MTSFVTNSDFLGIGEGKRKAKVEEEKRRTAELEAQLYLLTTQADTEASKVATQNKLKTYSIIAVMLIIIFTALYFIVKS